MFLDAISSEVVKNKYHHSLKAVTMHRIFDPVEVSIKLLIILTTAYMYMHVYDMQCTSVVLPSVFLTKGLWKRK